MGLRRSLCALAALLLAASASAQARPELQREIAPALFVARDADSTLYLFGTVHVRRPGAQWGGADAHAALAQAEEVWTEMEITPESQAQVRELTLRYGMASADRPLSSILNAEEYARLTAASQRLGLQTSILDRMRPWLAAITLTVAPMLREGFDPNAGVDRAIVAAAGAARLRAFETAEQQIGFLANLSEPMQRQLLLEAIDGAEEGAAALDALSRAWERGDLDALETEALRDLRQNYPELYAVVIRQRNLAWVETLMRELDGAGVDFVAVGAAHLVGEDGLVALLRARGVAVERVGEEARH